MKQLRTLAIIFSVLIGLLNSLSGGAASDTNASTFTTLIENQLATSSETSISTTDIAAAQVLEIIRKHLDAKILDRHAVAKGINFQITPTGSTASIQIALLEITYPNTEITLKKQKSLVPHQYFLHSKILTPFSFVTSNNRLLIVFTENAGNQEAVRFIKNFPGLWHNNIGSTAEHPEGK